MDLSGQSSVSPFIGNLPGQPKKRLTRTPTLVPLPAAGGRRDEIHWNTGRSVIYG